MELHEAAALPFEQRPVTGSLVSSSLSAQQLIHLQTTLIALSHDAMIVRDQQSHILSWNQGAEELYGWREEEVLGQITHVLLQTQFPDGLENIERALDQFSMWEGEIIHICRNDKQVIVESRQVLLRDDQLVPLAILEINRDVTERKQREGLTQERLRQAVQAETEALQHTNRMLNNFLGIAGHEIRTPLTTIKGSLQMGRRYLARLLRETTLESEVRKTLDEVQNLLTRAEQQADRQNRLVRDLLDITHIESGSLELHMKEVDMAQIIQEVVQGQRLLHPKRSLALQLPDVSPLLVWGDRERIGQVIEYYLSNAFKYSEARLPVSAGLAHEGGSVRVFVRDEGPGLTAEEQQRIWERFERVERIRVRAGSGVGLGLGLHISQKIIEQHDGHVGVESSVGTGSTFWFTLPLIEESGIEKQPSSLEQHGAQ